ncbi:uncharacterized protein PAC_06642 [Phialocephala subalpina]|uniref:Uncharacterized protein n=1 Tax=Phialocephala subalpina TaxID=576137 RepID=A0A1L7WVJ0_9HELO|nr:uncharacterized protein PAC_06642 [Phialocephala subalpina]
MPLLTKMLPLRETAEDLQAVASLHSQHQHQQKEGRLREEKDSGYEDFQEYDDDDDECLSSDMEGSVVHRGRPKKVVRAPPAIPARNEKRASKILESVMLELKTLDGTETKDTDSRSMVQESDPHESYLSSEEDASLSDDYEDSLTSPEDNLEDSTSPVESFTRTTRRRSQEDTARVVSFICVGKPQIVDIFIPSNHTSPVDDPIMKRHSMNLDALTSLTQAPSQPKAVRRPTPLKLYPSTIRRMSISSVTSSHTTSSNSTAPANTPSTNLSNINSNGTLPPRKSSRLAHNLTSLVTSTKSTFSTSYIPPSSSANPSTAHSFLSSDPFAVDSPNTPHNDEPTTPKTPTSAAAAWKRGLSKTLSKARKPSLQKLSMGYGNSSVTNLGSQQYNSSPQKSRDSRRVSTSHSNYSGLNLARIPSESHLAPEQKQQDADARSRSSVYSSDSRTHQQEPKETNVRRAETFAGLPSPRLAPEQSQSQARQSARYDKIIKAGPPPVPTDSAPTPTSTGRRSFSFASGIGGLGRRKSVKK